MTEELFENPPRNLSPRMEWLRRHGIKTRQEEDKTFRAWTGSDPDYSPYSASGESEDEALQRLAIKRGMRMWTEEKL